MSAVPGSGWERRVSEVAAAFVYPATPDLTVRPTSAVPVRGRPRRLAWSYAAALLALLAAGVLAVPQARAGVLEFLRLGAIRILLGPATATPLATPTPIMTPTAPALSGLTTLSRARLLAGFPILQPAYPAGLGPPEEVYFQQFEGQVVVTVWRAPAYLALYHITERDFAFKTVQILEPATVNGLPALWVRGPHLAQFRDTRVGEFQFVAGNVLIWTQGEVTYRLESELSLEETLRVAESLR